MTRISCWFGLKGLNLFLLVFSTMMVSCGSNNSEKTDFPRVISDFEKLPNDFKEFHEKFHVDSVYQINRINFPLRGLPAHFTEDDIHYEYQENEWVMHKPFDVSSDLYKREWILVNSSEIEEIIISTEADFGMSRTFKQSSGYWYLVYYAAMNRLSETGNPVGTENIILEIDSSEINSILDTIPMEKL